MRARTIAGVLLALTMGLAACGSSEDDTAATGDDSAVEEIDGSSKDATDAVDRGGDDAESADGDEDASTTSASAGGAEAASEPGSAVDADASDDRAAEEGQQVGLQAGSVDDNETWEQYLEYRADFAATGRSVPDIEVEGRRIFTVVDADGRPVHDATITVDGTTVRTGSDGRAVFFAPVDAQQTSGDLVARVAHGAVEAEHVIGNETDQQVVLDTVAVDGVRLDLFFLIDSTGSMADEIGRLQDTMTEVAARVAASPSAPDVRFGLTAYRDIGDDYVARTVDFTGDVDAFVDDLNAIRADGGGDRPEAFNEAFEQAVQRPSWRDDDGVVRLVILLADAPPHVERGTSYVDTTAAAMARGIRVFPIASSGTDDVAEYVFRQVAQATFGRFVFLSYGADGAATGETSNVDDIGYDVLALDDLVVRLVEEELAPLVSGAQ